MSTENMRIVDKNCRQFIIKCRQSCRQECRCDVNYHLRLLLPAVLRGLLAAWTRFWRGKMKSCQMMTSSNRQSWSRDRAVGSSKVSPTAVKTESSEICVRPAPLPTEVIFTLGQCAGMRAGSGTGWRSSTNRFWTSGSVSSM